MPVHVELIYLLRPAQLRAKVMIEGMACYIRPMPSRLFSAQLRFWRKRSGISQLELSQLADVSARHISFLETSRAAPSEDMILRILSALNVPLRQQNIMLQDAGYEPRFPDSDYDAMTPGIRAAIEHMLEKQEPYPMTVLNRCYDVIATNKASRSLLSRCAVEPTAMEAPLNVFSLVFDPKLIRPSIRNWEQVAKAMLVRLQRETLQCPENVGLKTLFERVLCYPGIPEDWHSPDLAEFSEPTIVVVLKHMQHELRFFTTTTKFAAARHAMLEEVQLESYFPLDEHTRILCEQMAASAM